MNRHESSNRFAFLFIPIEHTMSRLANRQSLSVGRPLITDLSRVNLRSYARPHVSVCWVMYALTHELTSRHSRYEIKIDFNDVEIFSEMSKKLMLISHSLEAFI